jgi:hypothetical protein
MERHDLGYSPQAPMDRDGPHDVRLEVRFLGGRRHLAIVSLALPDHDRALRCVQLAGGVRAGIGASLLEASTRIITRSTHTPAASDRVDQPPDPRFRPTRKVGGRVHPDRVKGPEGKPVRDPLRQS